jgi:hypothetical protein
MNVTKTSKTKTPYQVVQRGAGAGGEDAGDGHVLAPLAGARAAEPYTPPLLQLNVSTV